MSYFSLSFSPSIPSSYPFHPSSSLCLSLSFPFCVSLILHLSMQTHKYKLLTKISNAEVEASHRAWIPNGTSPSSAFRPLSLCAIYSFPMPCFPNSLFSSFYPKQFRFSFHFFLWFIHINCLVSPPDEDFLSETRLHHPHIQAGTTISISAIDAFSFDDVISAQVATPGHFFPHFRAAHSAFYGLITALRYQSVFYSFIPHFALRRSKTVR